MNCFGNKFKISIFGESHSPEVGITIEGVPAGITITELDFLSDLNRRKPGAKGTTTRIESDIPILSGGIINDITDGSPITISFKNENIRPDDYSLFKDHPRPGHADFTSLHKFGYNSTGGGIFSGRMTIGLVAAGVVAKKVLGPDINICATLVEIFGNSDITKGLESIPENDSAGGVIQCICKNVPIGVGEPFFDSLESIISHLAFSIPGVRGIEFGDGFASARMLGSEHNDPIIDKNGTTSKNGAGGINGGISNGNDIIFRVAIKPTSSIATPQQTFNFKTNTIETLNIKGRHDKCIALRCPVIIESIAAIAFANLL